LLARRPVSDATIGKAEHLKALLVEWMRRMNNGAMGYYSSNKYNGGQGRGDITEVTNRRTWRQVEYWQSDASIAFDPPTRVGVGDDRSHRRNEYLYVGRTTPGFLVLEPINITGPSKDLFTVSLTTKTIVRQFQYVRVTVALQSQAEVNMTAVEAYLNVEFNGGSRTIRLSGQGE
jgi:hypothetical protein